MAKKKGKPVSNVKFSLVARLNTRLFFRLAGVYLCMNLLIILMFGAGLLWWGDRQCSDISLLVEERGIPSAEATQWMSAGDYTVAAGGYGGEGWALPFPRSPGDSGFMGQRYFTPGHTDLFFFLLVFHTGDTTSYAVECTTTSGDQYTITLDLSELASILSATSRVLMVCQLISLVSSLLSNAGAIKKVLRPIQDLAHQAARLNTAMSPEELQALAGRLDAINATHLGDRIPVDGTQRELKTLAQSINSMLERLDQSYRSQARFVSDASHELRTPIAVIQGYANLLNRWGKDDPETMEEAINAICAEADAMQELVEQLLFLARGDNHTARVEPEIFDLTAVSSQLLKEFGMIDLNHAYAASWTHPVYVNADMSLIKQAMRILMDNASKYTAPGGRITLQVERLGQQARISVTDEGQGIAPQALPHIFDRFFRTDESRARQTGGTGLGLSIAHWIAEHHSGWFEVVSRQEVGTRITMVLPAIDPPAAAEEHP